MLRAIFYKEWLKTRWYYLVAVLLSLGFVGYVLLNFFRAAGLKGIAHLWEVMLLRDAVFVDCRENGIELFMKYPGYYEESKKTNDKNRFRASHFERTEDGGYICPAGHEFEEDKVTTDTRGVYARNNIKLINRHCDGCPFRSRCTKSRIGRSINYCKELDEFHKEVRKNVTSEEGKKLMFKRDNEAEGTFGDLKENMGYDRLYRRGHDNVQMEIYLVAMGHNIRKYQKLKKRIKETEERQMKQVREMLRLFIC